MLSNRLELLRLAALVPKTSVSTNSTTRALTTTDSAVIHCPEGGINLLSGGLFDISGKRQGSCLHEGLLEALHFQLQLKHLAFELL